jgi:hypothetical protein
MFVGHLGAGLAARAADERINLGLLFVAAMGLDAALWAFALAGWERFAVPPDFARRHYLLFDFPLSHSLLAALLWALAAALLWAWLTGGRRFAALIVALVIFSHWPLDALTHVPELSLWGGNSPRVGLDLLDHQPWALIAEGAVAALGLGLFLARTGLARRRKLAVAALVLVAGILTWAGSVAIAPPPGTAALALTSLAGIALIAALGAFVDRQPQTRG